MGRRHMLRALVLAAAGVALLAGVAPQARAAEPFQINAILPLTGLAAFLGQEENAALKVIEQRVNKAGGIDGRPIEFVIHDDGSNPQTGVQLFNQIAAAKNVSVVLGSSLVAVCNAVVPLVKDGPVDYCFSPGTHPPPGSFAFSSSLSTADLLLASIRYFSARGWHRIAIITSSDATGQDAERGIDAAVAAVPGESVIDREHFNTTDVSVTAQMAHVKTSGAQVLIAWSTGTPIATVFRGIQNAGIDIPIQTTNGNGTYAQMKAYAAFLPKNLLFAVPPAQAPDRLPNGQLKRVVGDFFDAFKPLGVKPDIGQSLAWDPTLLVLDAYRKLGLEATPAQIREYIDGLRDWVGVNGRYDFTALPQRGVGVENVIIARWDPAKETWVAVSKPGGQPL